MKSKWGNRLTEFWFAEVPATDLAVCRIVFYLGLLTATLDSDFHHLTYWASVADVIWLPYPILGRIHISRPDPRFVEALCLLWRLSLVTSCLGLFTRLSTLAAFGMGFYLIALPNNFGFAYHNDAFSLFVLGILAMSRCGDALSLDWLFRPRPLPRSYEYRWPVALICTLLALLYFGAGTNKLLNGGMAWIFSDNMALLLLRHPLTHLPPTDLGGWLVSLPGVPQAMALIAVGLEVGAPLALLGGRLRTGIVSGLFAMQLGIYLVLGLRFFTLLSAFCFWVPWGRVLKAVHSVPFRMPWLRLLRPTARAESF